MVALAHQFAVRLALVAFATATAQALFEGQAFEAALRFALGAAAGFWALGWVCGFLAQRAIEESVAPPPGRAAGAAP